MKKNGGITRIEYSRLTGVARLKAVDDLNTFIQEENCVREGREGMCFMYGNRKNNIIISNCPSFANNFVPLFVYRENSKIMARITIPYAVADFIDLRERGFYYVDKTDYIPKLEDYNAPVFLRPRRFGKSLLVSTLACYYDRTKAHRFEELFGEPG